MRQTLRKLIVGRGQRADHERRSTIGHRWENVRAIWNNTFEEDAGAYDQKDAEGFIRLNALRLRLIASRNARVAKK